jgi:hypothetical protein
LTAHMAILHIYHEKKENIFNPPSLFFKDKLQIPRGKWPLHVLACEIAGRRCKCVVSMRPEWTMFEPQPIANKNTIQIKILKEKLESDCVPETCRQERLVEPGSSCLLLLSWPSNSKRWPWTTCTPWPQFEPPPRGRLKIVIIVVL